MSNGHTLPLPTTQSLPEATSSVSMSDEDIQARDESERDIEQRLRQALGQDYELGPQIGRGGMGIVYRATDLRLKREVAVKVLPPEVAYRSDLRKRFLREAQMAASLTHPHIVSIYDVGHKNNVAYIVMAYIHGESVRDLIRRSGAQPSHVVARILREVAWALSYAHARGVVHRDIKPDNIMIERASGRAIVMDFGLAKLDSSKEDEHLTQPGKVLGTPAYMSPEQARGRDELDHRTDIYSLGMVGLHLLLGRNPFDGSSPQAIMARVITEDPPDIGLSRPDLPTWLTDALRKALQRSPTKRYDHAEEMADALDRGETQREIPTSVQSLLDLLEAYVELSTLFAWMLFIVGIPSLPEGTGVIFAALLALPVLSALQLIGAEGLQWEDIRDGITARRIHWLRSLSLKREVGIHIPSVAVLAATIFGVFLIRWIGPVLEFLEYAADPSMPFREMDMGPNQAERLFQGPRWALWYAILGSLVWARLFGLPITRRMTPTQLDSVASWHIPGWIDFFGRILFKRIGPTPGIVEATADFRQLTEPAVREAVAFLRTRRQMKWNQCFRLRTPIKFGNLAVRRLWWMHERLIKLRLKYKTTGNVSKLEYLAGAIDKRETMLSEFAAALSSLRMIMEDTNSKHSDMDHTSELEHVTQELKRLTAPVRYIRTFQRTFIASWIVLFGLRISMGVSAGAVGDAITITLFWSLVGLGLFQFFRRRIYS